MEMLRESRFKAPISSGELVGGQSGAVSFRLPSSGRSPPTSPSETSASFSASVVAVSTVSRAAPISSAAAS